MIIFLVIERDNQANADADAAIKRIYQFSTAGLTPLEDPAVGTVPNFPVIKKNIGS